MPDRQNPPRPDRNPERNPDRDPGRSSPGRERENDPRRGTEGPDRWEQDPDSDPDSGRTVRRADDAGTAGPRH